MLKFYSHRELRFLRDEYNFYLSGPFGHTHAAKQLGYMPLYRYSRREKRMGEKQHDAVMISFVNTDHNKMAN